MAVNLLDFDAQGLTNWCEQQGEKPFRAPDLLRWIHQRGENDFDAMTDIAKSFREKLKLLGGVSPAPAISDKLSDDGTRKFCLMSVPGTRLKRFYSGGRPRNLVCLVTSRLCARVRVCSTGRQGFNRNLTTAEIIGQLWQANRLLMQGTQTGQSSDRVISNVVMMGMGEPLTNFDNLIPA